MADAPIDQQTKTRPTGRAVHTATAWIQDNDRRFAPVFVTTITFDNGEVWEETVRTDSEDPTDWRCVYSPHGVWPEEPYEEREG